jgi:thioredoxin 1
MDKVVTVNAGNFEAEVLQATEPVVVDLWAEWCGPCRAAAPVLAELAGEYDGKVKVVKVNVDEEPEIAGAFEVQGIPTFAVLYKGGLVGKVSGFGGKAHLNSIFEQVAELPQKIAELEAQEAAGGAGGAEQKPEGS